MCFFTWGENYMSEQGTVLGVCQVDKSLVPFLFLSLHTTSTRQVDTLEMMADAGGKST